MHSHKDKPDRRARQSRFLILAHELAGSAIYAGFQLPGFVSTYNPDAHGGMGEVTLTRDLAAAAVFPTLHRAMEFIYQVPASRPLRGDGRPNRPITVFTLEILQYELD